MPKEADNYHKQHRTFLSMIDTVEYIRRHDDVPFPVKKPEVKQETHFEQMLKEAQSRLPDKVSGIVPGAMENL